MLKGTHGPPKANRPRGRGKGGWDGETLDWRGRRSAAGEKTNQRVTDRPPGLPVPERMLWHLDFPGSGSMLSRAGLRRSCAPMAHFPAFADLWRRYDGATGGGPRALDAVGLRDYPPMLATALPLGTGSGVSDPRNQQRRAAPAFRLRAREPRRLGRRSPDWNPANGQRAQLREQPSDTLVSLSGWDDR